MAKRKRGDGSVRLRKDGRWEGRYVVGRDEKGLPKTKNVLARTKAECEAKLKALREGLTEEKPDMTSPGVTLGAWLDHWYHFYKKPRLRPNTQMSYERRLYLHVIPQLGDTPLNKLTQNDLQQFYARLKQSGRLIRTNLYGPGLSDQTVRGIHITLSAALDQAVTEKLIRRNPADGCKLPPARAGEMKILTPEEIQRLLIQAKEDGCFELLLLELSTGLRRGEICALQWADLNLRTGALRVERQIHRVHGQLVVSQPKTSASRRSIILPGSVLKVLKQYQDIVVVDSRWMFPSPVKEDFPRDPSAVRKRLNTVLKRAECKHVRFHDLRHTFATTSLEHGMDVKTLSAIIGHVSSSTTLNVYAHITDDMCRSAASKIDQGIAKAAPVAAVDAAPRKPAPSTFQAKKGQRRKAGTGCISQITEVLWEGRYSPIWPDGKKRPRNIYAHSREECEHLLAVMIREEKEKIAAEKARLKTLRAAG